MKRAAFFILGFFFLCGCARMESPLLYPLKVGDRWEYETDSRGTMTLSVTAVEEADGREHFLLDRSMGPPGHAFQRDYYTSTGEGIFLVRRFLPPNRLITFHPPQKILPFKPEKERAWMWKGRLETETGTGQLLKSAPEGELSSETVGRERIKILGRWKTCLKVKSRGKVGTDLATLEIRWYVPGIGLVKDETTLTAPAGSSGIRADLKSYTLEK